MDSLTGKTLWITGASSGIGKELVYALAREKARLVLSARNEDALRRVAVECQSRGCATAPLVLPFDITNHDYHQNAVAQAERWSGGVDILINNAGIGQRARAQDTDDAVVRRIMEVNFFAPVSLTKAILPSMLKRKSGRIVVISSLMGKIHLPGRSTYAASKHAIQGYFNTLRSELQGSGVDVTLVCPGWIGTPFSENALTGEGALSGISTSVGKPKMGPAKCAAAIVRAIKAGKREAIIGGIEVWGRYLALFAPGVYDRIARSKAAEFSRY